jgi:hypothetical protein
LSDTRNSLVRSEDSILTTAIRLDDVIVISTSDAVLVTARAKVEERQRRRDWRSALQVLLHRIRASANFLKA